MTDDSEQVSRCGAVRGSPSGAPPSLPAARKHDLEAVGQGHRVLTLGELPFFLFLKSKGFISGFEINFP